MANGNVFTTEGKGDLTALMVSGTGPFDKWMSWGKATTTPTVSDTGLGTELTTADNAGYARVAAPATQQTTSVSNDTYQLQGSITSAGTVNPLAITEAGDHSASTSGNIALHSVFGVVNEAPGDTLTTKLQLQFT